MLGLIVILIDVAFLEEILHVVVTNHSSSSFPTVKTNLPAIEL